MGLFSRLRDGLTGSPEFREQFREHRRKLIIAGPIEHAAREIAYQNVSDQEARDRLRTELADEQAARSAVEMFAQAGRDSFIKDRAYRLLTAALDDTEVRSIDPAVREEFLREEALGWMPLEEAFEQLALLEPGLSQLVGRDNEGFRDKKAFARVRDQSRGLVGIGARSRDPLLRSDLAASIVVQYVAIRRGRLIGDLTAAYFETRLTSSFSGSFLGGGVDRPRATN